MRWTCRGRPRPELRVIRRRQYLPIRIDQLENRVERLRRARNVEPDFSSAGSVEAVDVGVGSSVEEPVDGESQRLVVVAPLGIVGIVRGRLLWGIVLIVVGLLVGPGGVSIFNV